MPGNSKPPHQRQITFLRAWRKTKGLTQAEVGAQIGLDQANVGRMERAVTPYDQDWLEMLAKIYGCSPADLLGRDPRQRGVVDAAVAKLRTAHPGIQRQIAGYIDAKVSEGGEVIGEPSANASDSPDTPHMSRSEAGLLTQQVLRASEDRAAKAPGKQKGSPPSQPGTRKSPKI